MDNCESKHRTPINKTDVLTGQIVQKVLDARFYGKCSVIYGVGNFFDIERLLNNLLYYFPECSIELKKLDFGYELRITIKE